MKPLRSNPFSVIATTVIAGLVSISMTGGASAQQTAVTDNDTQPLNLISGLGVTSQADNKSAPTPVAGRDKVAPNPNTDDPNTNKAASQEGSSDPANAIIGSTGIDNTGTDSTGTDSSGSFVLTLGKSSASDVGIAAIGVNGVDRPFSDLDTLIWRGSSAAHANLLLANGVVPNASGVLTAISGDVVAQQSVPAGGANLIVEEVVETRLNWLARAGRSQDLVEIVRQLPDEPRWDAWKKWLVQAQLMAMDDTAACATVTKIITKTIDPFWHKAKVLCAIVDGNIVGARFAADILRDSGVDDPVFFALIEEMLSEVPAAPFDPASLTPMHVVLMDIVRHEIDLDALRALPHQMTQAAVNLRYLSDEARMVSTYDALALGLIDATAAGDLWRNIETVAATAESALVRHASKPTALTMAMGWRALDQQKTGARLPLIATMMQDSTNQQMRDHTAPLFAALAREALNFEDAEPVLSKLDETILGRIALLLALDAPDNYALPGSFPRADYAENAAALLRALDGGSMPVRVLTELDMWHVLPLLEASGVTFAEPDWVELLALPTETVPNMASTRQMMSLSLPMLRAIEQAASKRRVAETILLANWIIGDTPLGQINPADAGRVIRAIAQLGQTQAAQALAMEFVRAYLWVGASEDALAAQTGAWIVPQPLANEAAANATEATQDNSVASAPTATDNISAVTAADNTSFAVNNNAADNAADNMSETASEPATAADESDGVASDGDQTDQ